MKCSIKKATVTIIALAILVGGIFLAIYLKQVADYKHAVSEISIEEISLCLWYNIFVKVDSSISRQERSYHGKPYRRYLRQTVRRPQGQYQH